MDLVSVRALRGPNIWARKTVLVVTARMSSDGVDVGAVESRVAEWLPSLPAPSLSLTPAAVLPLLLERTLRALLTGAGCRVDFYRACPTDAPDTWEIVVEYAE